MFSSEWYMLGLAVSTSPTKTIKLLGHSPSFQKSMFFSTPPLTVYEGKRDPNAVLGRQLPVTSVSGVSYLSGITLSIIPVILTLSLLMSYIYIYHVPFS